MIARESDACPLTQPKALELVRDYDQKSQKRAYGAGCGGQFGDQPAVMSGCGMFEQ